MQLQPALAGAVTARTADSSAAHEKTLTKFMGRTLLPGNDHSEQARQQEALSHGLNWHDETYPVFAGVHENTLQDSAEFTHRRNHSHDHSGDVNTAGLVNPVGPERCGKESSADSRCFWHIGYGRD